MAADAFDPLQELGTLGERVRGLVEQTLAGVAREFAGEGRAWRPRLDLYLADDDVVLEVELPGVRRADVEVSATQDAITVRGDAPRPDAAGDRQHIHEERLRGPFARKVAMPVAVDAQRVRASFADGVLTIRAPKQTPGEEPRRIRIE